MNAHVPGDFPSVHLSAADHAQADVYLHGAHVASRITPDGHERLFLSQHSEFRPGAALRGGIPVIFPQFAGFGPLPKHGFARVLPWESVTVPAAPGPAAAHFHVRDSDETRRRWDHPFQLDLAVEIDGMALRVALQVTNPGPQAFTFTAALHTYLRVSEIGAVSVEGLRGLAFREHGADGLQTEDRLSIRGEVDRIYWNVPGPLTLHDSGQQMHVEAAGFPDVVIWNPGPDKGAALADLEPEGYRRMLCIEAAVIGRPVALAPGGTWQGAQLLTASAAS